MEQKTDTPASEQFSFVEAEKSVLNFWNKEQIFKKSLEKTSSSKPYIFYDGPPFATGLPHHGHLVASTLKDIIPRYFTMKGYYVSRRFGWDCHGLPIEQEIDKKFGMSANDYVAANGVKSYNDQCRGIVDRYTNEWEKTISRLGRWVDFQNDYKTMDLTFMESVWWVFKSVWDKDLIYQGNKIVPYSPALQTALSNFEATSNYQDIQDPAVTVLFRTKKDPNTYFAAWTTTPWTLPSNLSLCVHPEIEYVKVKDLDKNIFIIMAKARLEAYKNSKFEEVETMTGASLTGERYEPLFPYHADLAKDGYYVVLNDEYVTTTDGTGIVHQAPAFGEDDNRVMKAAGLTEVILPMDPAGKFTADIVDFKGMYFKDADKEIIKNLKDRGQLFHQSTLVHSYPMCYRTDTPLMYRAMPQWYLAVERIKEKMINANAQINWVPSHIQEGRFGKWLEGSKDWAISRTRVWGTPLPIWINDTTGKQICIGSVAELEKLTGTVVKDLHREYVDGLDFKIAGEEGTYKRIPEVLDCWFESGSMPYAQLHYPFENKEVFQNGFPAEFIAEGLDQTRGWFYTLTVLSAALFDKPAFKNVIVNGMVLAKDGKKMSKRLKNYTAPDELLEAYGADALRLFLINSGVVKGEELRFTDEGVKDMVRRALLPWFNSFKFFSTYAQVDGWSAKKNMKLGGENILDRWLLSKLQTLITKVNTEMQAYRLFNVVPELMAFIDDLTNWYIRLNRRRFWEDGLTQDKCEAYSTLYTTLDALSRMMAPFTPFLSEHIYLELKKFGALEEQSVHLCAYPEAEKKLINATLETAVDRMQQVILLGRQKRLLETIKVKTPLSVLKIIHQDQALLDEIQKLEVIIQTELNVKSIEYHTDEANYIRLYAKPNSPVLGKKLGKEMGLYTKKISELGYTELQKVEAGQSISIDGKEFSSDEILTFREAKAGTQAVTNRFITIDLNCTLDQKLIDEGHAREMVNRIQKTRKELNFNVDDRISIKIFTDANLTNVFNQFKDYISKETLTSESEIVDFTPAGAVKHEIDEADFFLSVQKK